MDSEETLHAHTAAQVMYPTVTFIVPCYKLAHLLPECINSILSQTYADFEVLVMDDCSPDNTQEVARSFQDPRVKYFRNASNVGHLRNYNRGIALAGGKYIWLISADDYLRRTYILERYVKLLDGNPKLGYVFCPGVGVRNGQETGVVEWAIHWSEDRIIDGHVLLKELLWDNKIVAASGLVRRECYERISLFPLDMPWAGDWYLWCVFALHFNVGYFAEPMVCYREHDLTMTTTLREGNVGQCVSELIGMPWAIKRKADEGGYKDISRKCLRAAAAQYVRCMTSRLYSYGLYLTKAQVEESLARNTSNETERNTVRARVCAGLGDHYYCQGEVALAKQAYLAGLGRDFRMPKVFAKLTMLWLGVPGIHLRTILRSLRKNRRISAWIWSDSQCLRERSAR